MFSALALNFVLFFSGASSGEECGVCGFLALIPLLEALAIALSFLLLGESWFGSHFLALFMVSLGCHRIEPNFLWAVRWLGREALGVVRIGFCG